MIGLFKLIIKVVNLYNLFFNTFLFKIYKIKISKFNINGRIFVRGCGKIKIGVNFKANSGTNHNPIGGDTKLRLICKNTGVITIGENVGISNSSIVCWNNIEIQDNVMIGGGCKIWDTDFHSLNTEVRTKGNDDQVKLFPIIIKTNAFIGGSSIILKGVTIGENSIIAAGSVVTKNVPKNQIWGGNPAKLIRKLDN